MLAFGWASVSIRADGELIEDWQGDIIAPCELEEAAYEYVISSSQQADILLCIQQHMHILDAQAEACAVL